MREPKQPIFASEAFEALSRVPSPKAWVKISPTSFKIMGEITLTKELDGTIKGGDHLPLMFNAEQATSIANGIAEDICATFSPRLDQFTPFLRPYFNSGIIDQRFSPKGREELKKITGRLENSSVALILETLRTYERQSFAGRVQKRVLGYARGGAQGIAKLINSVLWSDLYDREIANAAIQAFGHKAKIAEYNMLAQAWRAPDERLSIPTLIKTHRPGLVFLHPLLNLPFKDQVAPAYDFSTLGHIPAAAHRRSIAETISMAPRHFKKAGLKPAVWRMFLKMTVPQMMALRPLLEKALNLGTQMIVADMWGVHHTIAQEDREDTMALAFLNRLAEVEGERLPRAFLRQLSFRPLSHLRDLIPILHIIVRAGADAKRRGRVHQQAGFISMVSDAWTSFTNDRLPIVRATRLTWLTLLREQEQWHANLAHHFDFADESLEWDPLLPRLDTPTTQITELTNSNDLELESRAMHHCVRSYAPSCYSSSNAGKDAGRRIFSLKLVKRSIIRSTIEVHRNFDRKWVVSQHRAFGNAAPHKDLLTAAKQLTRSLNKAQRQYDLQAALPFKMAA